MSRELPLFNYEHHDILCSWIGHPCEQLWPFEFLERFRCSISNLSIYYVLESDIRVISYDHLNFSRGSVVQFQASRYIMRLNRTSVVRFQVSRYIMLLNRTSMWKVMTIGTAQGHPLFHFKRLDILCPRIVHSCEKLWPLKILESFYCLISGFSIYYVPELYIRVKSYDHLNFSRASIV